MQKQITRTFKRTTAIATVINLETMEVSNRPMTAPEEMTADRFNRWAERNTPNGTKFLKAVDHCTTEQMFGLPYADFIANAHIVSKRTANTVGHTFTVTVATVTLINLETMEVCTAHLTAPEEMTADRYNRWAEKHAPNGTKFLKAVDHRIAEHIYEMSEAQFLTLATPIEKRYNAIH